MPTPNASIRRARTDVNVNTASEKLITSAVILMNVGKRKDYVNTTVSTCGAHTDAVAVQDLP